MDDRELEQLLRSRLHRRFDRAEASGELIDRVTESLRPEPIRHAQVAWALLLVAAAIVVAVLGLGSRAVIVGPAATPTPRPSTDVGPTWTGLAFEDITAAAPSGYINDVVRAATGYVAVTDHALWTSTDERTWALVPNAPPIVYVSRAPGGLLGAAYRDTKCVSGPPSGSSCTAINELWRSADGTAWQPVSFDAFARGSITALAGDEAGAVVAGTADGVTSIYTSLDGTTWRQATASADLPTATVTGLGVVGARYVGIGFSGEAPVARAAAWFSSADGASWQSALLSAPAADDPSISAPLTGLHVGAYGAEAIGTEGGPPVTTAWWRTADGRAWTWDSGSDPLSHTSVAEHGAAGYPTPGDLASDGARIIVTGMSNGVLEAWSSAGDGTWTWVAVGGTLPADVVRSFVLADGLLVKTASTVLLAAATMGEASVPTLVPATAPPATATIAPPGGSVPPISGTTWSTLHVSPIDGGPTSVEAFTQWSGGHLALGHAIDGGPLTGWVSRDGSSWTALSPDAFGSPVEAVAAPAGNQVMVVTIAADGLEMVRMSSDGISWTTAGSPPLRTRQGSIAGNERGLVALTNDPQFQLAFTRTGSSWSTISIPGLAVDSLQAVTSFNGGFVAVGALEGWTSAARSSSSSATPAAWWSPDGLTWTRATVDSVPGDGFVSIAAGRDGLVAESTQPGMVPGQAHFWTSPDGRSWRRSDADPMGIYSGGAGEGSAAGLFRGDGTRILGYGATKAGQPTEFWTSFDGESWSRLALSDINSATTARVRDASPWLLRDGVLFSGRDGAWYGRS